MVEFTKVLIRATGYSSGLVVAIVQVLTVMWDMDWGGYQNPEDNGMEVAFYQEQNLNRGITNEGPEGIHTPASLSD